MKPITLFITFLITLSTIMAQATWPTPAGWVNFNTNHPGNYISLNVGYTPNISQTHRLEWALDAGMTLDRSAMFMDSGYNVYNTYISQKRSATPTCYDYTWLMTGMSHYVPSGLYNDIFSSPGVINPANQWGKWVYDCVNYNKANIKMWCLWNEPDINWSNWQPQDGGENWADWEGNTDEFARMMEVTYMAAKAADPGCWIAVQLAFTNSYKILLDRNAGHYFDIVDFHAYAWPESDYAMDNLIKVKESAESIIRSYGYDGTTYPEKLFICTETGYSYDSPTSLGNNERQRRWAFKSQAVGASLDLIGTSWYQLFDPSWENMGLIDDVTGLDDSTYTSAVKRDAYWSFLASSKLIGTGWDYIEDVSTFSGNSIGYVFYNNVTGKYRITAWTRGETSIRNETINTTTVNIKKYTWDAYKPPNNGANTTVTGDGTSISVQLTSDPVVFEMDNFQLTSGSVSSSSSQNSSSLSSSSSQNSSSLSSSSSSVVTPAKGVFCYPNPISISSDESIRFTDFDSGNHYYAYIYTISGEKIWEGAIGDEGWNLRNIRNQKVTPGTYIYYIVDSLGKGVTGYDVNNNIIKLQGKILILK